MNKIIQQLLDFFHLCERIKTEYRHGKTSDNENDRVASHSWRLAILILFINPFLGKNIDLLKAIKIALIHDLPESITGDQAYFKHMFNQEEKDKKRQKENKAIEIIAAKLPTNNKNELLHLWQEYESQLTYESKVVKALDKIEAQIQHNEADISVWNKYDRKHYNTFLDQFCDFDESLKVLKVLVQNESKKKLSSS